MEAEIDPELGESRWFREERNVTGEAKLLWQHERKIKKKKRKQPVFRHDLMGLP